MLIALNESGSKADVNDSVDFSKVGYSDFYANAENVHVNNSIYEEEAISKMSKIAENEFLELYLDEVETVVGIRDKKSGALWFSNPVNEEEDTFSSGYYQKILKSQLYLTYIDKNTKISTMNNYTSSIENGQFEIEKMENGVKITYLIADSALTIQLPDAISVERMEKFLELMSAEQAKKMKRNYTLYSYGSWDVSSKKVITETRVAFKGKVGEFEVSIGASLVDRYSLNNLSFEEGETGWIVSGDTEAGWFTNKDDGYPHDGDWCFAFWDAGDFTLELYQYVKITETNQYNLKVWSEGKGNTRLLLTLYIADEDGKYIDSDSFQNTGWADWKNPCVTANLEEGDIIRIGVKIQGSPDGWGALDEFSFTSVP